MANENGWGDGSVNNSIGWGKGAINNSIGWGSSQLTSWSGATDIDGGNAPTNTVAPAITGTAQEGQTLTCSTGTWTGSPTYTYQWKRNGNNITSATNSTYTLVTADVSQSIKCTVTATNILGSANADSNTVVPISAFTGLLDTYSGAAAAYSLRRLRTGYTGNLIRVRRSSDNTEQNIGYNSNNVLDTASLLTFCGAGNGFITTWYDQSGNSRNATNATAANQPRIVNAGTVETLNGKPSIFFDGTNDRLNTSSFALGTEFSFISAFSTVDTNNYNKFYQIGADASSAGYAFSTFAGATGQDWLENDSLFFGKGYGVGQAPRIITNGIQFTNNIQYLIFLNLSNTASNAYKNGTEISYRVRTTGTTDNASNILYLGASDTNIQNYNGRGQELIFYPSNQNSNRTGIQTNINAFYSIY
jgi:hypothetical protein